MVNSEFSPKLTTFSGPFFLGKRFLGREGKETFSMRLRLRFAIICSSIIKSCIIVTFIYDIYIIRIMDCHHITTYITSRRIYRISTYLSIYIWYIYNTIIIIEYINSMDRSSSSGGPWPTPTGNRPIGDRRKLGWKWLLFVATTLNRLLASLRSRSTISDMLNITGTVNIYHIL